MIPLCNYEKKLLILYVILPIRFFLGLEQKKHLMNYGLRENLILNILRPLAMNAIYLGIGGTLVNLMLDLI